MGAKQPRANLNLWRVIDDAPANDGSLPSAPGQLDTSQSGATQPDPEQPDPEQSDSERSGSGRAGPERVEPPHAPHKPIARLPISQQRTPGPGFGRRSRQPAIGTQGHIVRTVPIYRLPTGVAPLHGRVRDIALAATLRAAVQRQMQPAPLDSRPEAFPGLAVRPEDLRLRERLAPGDNLVLFVVDASGSMGARQRMAAVKGILMGILLDTYQKRDHVALITFRNQEATLVVPSTRSVDVVERSLRSLATGGTTPLLAGLNLADTVLTQMRQRRRDLEPILVLVTDGRANEGEDTAGAIRRLAHQRLAKLVIDCEEGRVRLGLAKKLAEQLVADLVHLRELAF